MYENCFQWAKDTMKHKEKKFPSKKKRAVNTLVIKEHLCQ